LRKCGARPKAPGIVLNCGKRSDLSNDEHAKKAIEADEYAKKAKKADQRARARMESSGLGNPQRTDFVCYVMSLG